MRVVEVLVCARRNTLPMEQMESDKVMKWKQEGEVEHDKKRGNNNTNGEST